jgi:Na+-translocating ferredoxin:NAD+ oxidoreductase RnfE subunit
MSGTRGEDRRTVLVLALCPAAAASTRLEDALWLAAGTAVVLVACSALLPLLRPRLPGAPAGRGALTGGVLLLSSLVTAAFELALGALAPAAAARLGAYVPLVAATFLLVGRLGEALDAPTPGRAAVDAARLAGAFAAVLSLLALAREALGAGTVTLGATWPLGPLVEEPARALGLGAGALLLLGYAAAALRAIGASRRAKAGEERP